MEDFWFKHIHIYDAQQVRFVFVLRGARMRNDTAQLQNNHSTIVEPSSSQNQWTMQMFCDACHKPQLIHNTADLKKLQVHSAAKKKTIIVCAFSVHKSRPANACTHFLFSFRNVCAPYARVNSHSNAPNTHETHARELHTRERDSHNTNHTKQRGNKRTRDDGSGGFTQQ